MEGNTRGGGHADALKNYNVGRTLGIGTFGKVRIAEHKHTGHKVAIKILNRRQMRTLEMEEKGMTPCLGYIRLAYSIFRVIFLMSVLVRLVGLFLIPS